MKLPFGFELRRRPDPLEKERELEQAVAHVNAVWSECRDKRLMLSLWIEWDTKELVITELRPVRKGATK